MSTPEQDHRELRPYKMAHEGREIFGEWFNSLAAAYHATYGSRGMYVPGAPELVNTAETIAERLMQLNRGDRGDTNIQAATLEPHRDFLSKYTSADSFVKTSLEPVIDNPGEPLVLSDAAIRQHATDTISFFVRLPLAMAYETVKFSPLTRERDDHIDLVKEALGNPTFSRSLEELATTGFAVLGNRFSFINRPHNMGGPRDYRRRRLGAQPDDPEIITISELEDGSHQYNLSPWAKSRLAEELRRQNEQWPQPYLSNQSESQISFTASLNAGSLTQLPRPFSSGCPIKNFRPLCEFLDSAISTPGHPNKKHDLVKAGHAIINT